MKRLDATDLDWIRKLHEVGAPITGELDALTEAQARAHRDFAAAKQAFQETNKHLATRRKLLRKAVGKLWTAQEIDRAFVQHLAENNSHE